MFQYTFSEEKTLELRLSKIFLNSIVLGVFKA